MTYAGRVYDGPWEGRQIHHDRPWYEFNLLDYGSARAISRHRPLPMDAICQRVEYRWSDPLRAWVFVWPSRRR